MQACIDWDVEGPRQDRIVGIWDRTLLRLKQNIHADFFMTPKDFASDYLSSKGSGFSVRQSFPNLPGSVFITDLRLCRTSYLVGAGTHPGASVPGVLCSAKVIDRITPDCLMSFVPTIPKRSFGRRAALFLWQRGSFREDRAAVARLYSFAVCWMILRMLLRKVRLPHWHAL